MSEPPEVVVDGCNGVDDEHSVKDDAEVAYQNGEDGYVIFFS